MKIHTYALAHATVAIFTMVALFSLRNHLTALDYSFIGSQIIYLSREIRDLEKLHNWNIKGMDWPGLLYPMALGGLVWGGIKLYLLR